MDAAASAVQSAGDKRGKLLIRFRDASSHVSDPLDERQKSEVISSLILLFM